MTFQETVSHTIINLFIHPFHYHKPTDFQTALSKTKRVLIICPAVKNIPASSDLFIRFAGLFTKAEIQLVFPEQTKGDLLDGLLDQAIFLEFSKATLWNCLKSPALKDISQKNWDVLLDLDIAVNTLTAYLCRQLLPDICIGFQKQYSHRIFNLEYNSKPKDPYAKKLDGLFAFLKQFMDWEEDA
jgi:hypothetical protein